MRFVPLFAAACLLIGTSAMAQSTAEQVQAHVKQQADQLLDTVHANVYAPDMPLNIALDQLLVTNQEVEQDEQYTLLTGCRPQSCGEKAAAILHTPTQALAGAALLSFNCKDDVLAPEEIDYLTQRQPGKKPALHCARQPALMMYLIRDSIAAPALYAERELVDRFRRWAKKSGYQGESINIINRY